MHWPGIEPGPPAWQARILPLNHQCFYVQDYRTWFTKQQKNGLLVACLEDYIIIFNHLRKPIVIKVYPLFLIGRTEKIWPWVLIKSIKDIFLFLSYSIF